MRARNVLRRAMLSKPKKSFLPVLLVCGVATLACNRGGGSGGAAADPKTEDDKVFYALGLDIGKNIEVFSLKPNEAELLKAGLSDAIAKRKPKVDLEVVRPKIFEMARKRQEAKAGEEKQKGKAAVDKAAKEPGAQQLPSGLVIKSLRPGTGASPAESDTVKVHYEGRLTDGTVFDSSYKRKEPAEFPLKGVVRCWTEGLQKMKIGEKAQLTCPSDIAYGEQGRPPTIPGGATLVFDVELLEIKAAPPPAAPTPPPAAPAAAAAKPAKK